jgi:hypothetical protein
VEKVNLTFQLHLRDKASLSLCRERWKLRVQLFLMEFDIASLVVEVLG